MAEGGGTVSWLQRPDGNSSHYVVEYNGRITQMVEEDMAAGSINPNLVRTTDDSAYDYLGESIRYGVTANKGALGDAWRDPNAAVIAIETEGFAKDGPNTDQEARLKQLVADIRSRWGKLPVLGHRDFQDYKACPGKLIPWIDYGGHGPDPDVEEEMLGFTLDPAKPHHGKVEIVGTNVQAIYLDDGSLVGVFAGEQKEHIGFGKLDKPYGTGTGAQADRKTGWLLYGPRPAWLLAYAGREVPSTAPGPDIKHDVHVSVSVNGVEADTIDLEV